MKKQLFALPGRESIRNSLSDPDFKVYGIATGDGVELILDGIVGDEWEGMDSLSISRFLAANRGKPVHITMNSPGGFVFDGLAAYNAIAAHDAPTSGTITGQAGSAMSIIAMAVDDLAIAGNAVLFIHRAWGATYGNAAQLRDIANWLDTIDEGLVDTYVARTGLPKATIRAMVEGDVDGTPIGAKQALEMGFVDSIVPLKGEDDEPEQEPENKSILRSPVATRGEMARIEAQLIGIQKRHFSKQPTSA